MRDCMRDCMRRGQLGTPGALLFVWGGAGTVPPSTQVLITAPSPHRFAPLRLGGAGVVTPRVKEASQWRPPPASTTHVTAAPRPRRCIPSRTTRSLLSTCQAPCRARLRTSPRRSIASRGPGATWRLPSARASRMSRVLCGLSPLGCADGKRNTVAAAAAAAAAAAVLGLLRRRPCSVLWRRWSGRRPGLTPPTGSVCDPDGDGGAEKRSIQRTWKRS